jgi:hypothetical protein
MPALLKIKRYIENDVWKLMFSLDAVSLSENDKELIRKFGEPEINIGGIYLSGSPEEYTLQDRYLRVRTDLPHIQEFDSKSLNYSTQAEAQAAAQTQALAFQTAFVTKYEEAFSILRTTGDNFTGEYIENI